MKNLKLKKSQKGATFVEFAIIGILFFAILFALLEFGIYAFKKYQTEEALESALKMTESQMGNVFSEDDTSSSHIGPFKFNVGVPCDQLVNMKKEQLIEVCEDQFVFCSLYQIAQKASAGLNKDSYTHYSYGKGTGDNSECSSPVGIILPGFYFNENEFKYKGIGGESKSWVQYAKNIFTKNNIKVQSEFSDNAFTFLRKFFGFNFTPMTHYGIARPKAVVPSGGKGD